jgi:WhiB family redox-sensing transcriptional regulator
MSSRPHASRLDPHRDHIIRDYRRGATLDDIATKYGCARATAYAWLTKQGVQLRAPARRSLAQLVTPEPPGDWLDQAECARCDPELWHSPVRQAQAEARRICRTVCPVQVECLQWALRQDALAGIVGGHTEEERQGMRRRAS